MLERLGGKGGGSAAVRLGCVKVELMATTDDVFDVDVPPSIVVTLMVEFDENRGDEHVNGSNNTFS